MRQNRQNYSRLIAIAVLAGALLLAIVIATGGGFPSTSTSGAPTAPSAPTAAAAPTTGVSGHIQGKVTASVRHLRGRTWQFLYTVRNSGKVPIAGFQINGPRSNLFHIVNRPSWNYFGNGVCGGQPAGILIYWSTSSGSASIISPGSSAVLGFTVKTSGPTTLPYSLSWGTAAPKFGTVQGPAASSLPAGGPCKS